MPTTQLRLDGLRARALALGADATALVLPASLVVQEHLAALCGAPHRCPSYGLAPSCPPHAIKPAAFSNLLLTCRDVLVFKIDASVSALMGQERLAIARRIHAIAATIEQEASASGWRLAKGFAAGSCKELFCPELAVCRVLEQGSGCPHAGLARPSLSAMGVDFALLTESVGWQFAKIPNQPAATDEPIMGLMAGLVLLG